MQKFLPINGRKAVVGFGNGIISAIIVMMIEAENPGPFTLCGTNCYILGKGKMRSMIEAGDYPEKNSKFLENLTASLLVPCLILVILYRAMYNNPHYLQI